MGGRDHFLLLLKCVCCELYLEGHNGARSKVVYAGYQLWHVPQESSGVQLSASWGGRVGCLEHETL